MSPVKPCKGQVLSDVIARCRFAFAGAAFFSALINILMLTGSFYMLEVYDRVIPSRSIPTLVVLSLLALALFAFQGGLEVVRFRVFARIGVYLDAATSDRVFQAMSKPQSGDLSPGAALQPMRDIDSVKTFLSSGGPGGFFDLPWLPFYVAVMFLFHWVLGVTALMGAGIMVSLTFLTEFRTTKPAREMTKQVAARAEIALAGRRNAEVIAAMGMGTRIAEQYREAGTAAGRSQIILSDVGNGLGSISRVFRMLLQSLILGIGALLVIWNESSAGIMITGAILMGRALAPIDQVISNWKGFVAARQAWTRLEGLLDRQPPPAERMTLPQPRQYLNVDRLSVLEPGGRRYLIRDITFRLEAGQSLCVIGPSGAGKSTLMRALVNAWQPSAGRVELDGVPLGQWPPEELGNQIGYLPQDVELLSGTIATNVSRYQTDPDPERVIEATSSAGVHKLITRFRDGYQTQIGDSGAVLSAGQRQRLALARAMYGNPFLLVLDEPNSNLDAEGDAALLHAIQRTKERNGIVVAVSHRPSVLEVFDLVLIMSDGQLHAFGAKDEILKQHVLNSAVIRDVQRKGASVVPINGPQDGHSST